MKYVKSFGDFLLEKHIIESGESINEATKWTKYSMEKLGPFLAKFPKMVEGEYDPKTAKISTAIDNIYEMGMFLPNAGRSVWKLQNPDKCEVAKWTGTKWEKAEDEKQGEAWVSLTKEYIDALKAGFEMTIDAISAIEKGNAKKVESVVNNLASHMDKTYKNGKKLEKQNQLGVLNAKSEYQDEIMPFFRKFHDEMLNKVISATSNEKAIENLKGMLKNN